MLIRTYSSFLNLNLNIKPNPSPPYGTTASTFKNPLSGAVNVASYCSYPEGNPAGCGLLFNGVTVPVNPVAKLVADFTV